MKKFMLIFISLILTSCSSGNSIMEKIGNLDKAKCYDPETKSIKIGCKK